MGSKKNSSKKNKEPVETKADKSEAAEHGKVGGHGGNKLSTDPRFASVHLDPRFAKMPKNKAKVAIDSRFEHMFTDKKFASSTAPIDKRGKVKKDLSRDGLKHYYRLEEEKEENKKAKRKRDVDDEKDISSEEDSDERVGELEKASVNLSDLEMDSDSDASESDEDEESGDGSAEDTEEEDENGISLAEEDTFVQNETVPEIDQETRRLAVVNLDWGRVKAVDLYVLLSSFLPKGGQMLSVAVYPSEFGLQRMEEEAVRGPVGLFDDEKEKKGSDDDDDDDDEDEIDNEKLRAYERSRLRYYYAVVECDSVATADYLYKSCDGVEFERSSNKLDLRFIPDSMEFKHPPRDVAKESPADYEGLDFQTRALQLSKIDLTWDEDEPQRTRMLKRKLNADQLDKIEMEEFLASEESETDEDEHENDETADLSEKKLKKKNMYRALLQSGEGSDEGDKDEDGDQDMEVTFNTGLEDLSKRILEKKDTESETVWEKHLRKMKEKKQARRNRSKNSSEDESDDDNKSAEEMDDFFIDESSVKGGKSKSNQTGKNNKEEDKEADEKSRAELELLLADANGADAGVKGYNMKRKKLKGKKGKEIPDDGKIPTIDYEDPRFSSLFKSPHYALDPTDPQFKRSAVYARQLKQKQRGGEEEESNTIVDEKLARPSQLESHDMMVSKKEKNDKHELSSLVKSLKMKSNQFQIPSNDMVSKKQKREKR